MADGSGQIDIQDILNEIRAESVITTSHREKIENLMRRFAAASATDPKWTLAYIAGPRILHRKVATLRAYCRDFQLRFPDYIPRDLKATDAEREAVIAVRKAAKLAASGTAPPAPPSPDSE